VPVADGREALVLALALLLAWGLDLAFGEPRDELHPVAWLGRLAGPVGRWLRQRSPAVAMAGGTLAWWGAALALGAGAWALQAAIVVSLPVWLAVPVMALLLKPMFAWRMLRDEVAAVEDALARADGGEAAARERLSRLVSRDVGRFDAGALRETAIETLSENLCDSVIAPLFWAVVAGLPGAVVYRMANTLDAMWGYRGPWEWAGKWSARADDVLSWAPARLTALLLLRPAVSLSMWRTLRVQAKFTPSPNGGWPMGAMALRLGVRLGKPGVYVLNEGAAVPRADHVAQALRHAGRAAWAGALLAAVGCAGRAWW
jgi:adenosylcobinamide-phosphate synthase